MCSSFELARFGLERFHCSATEGGSLLSVSPPSRLQHDLLGDIVEGCTVLLFPLTKSIPSKY